VVRDAEAEFNKVANDQAATFGQIFDAYKAVRVADGRRHGVGMAVTGVLTQCDPLPNNPHSGADQTRVAVELQFRGKSFAEVLDQIVEAHSNQAVHAAMLQQQRAIGAVADAAQADARAAAERSRDGRVDVELPETFVQKYDRRLAELDGRPVSAGPRPCAAGVAAGRDRRPRSEGDLEMKSSPVRFSHRAGVGIVEALTSASAGR
jgi:hypothetical protein